MSGTSIIAQIFVPLNSLIDTSGYLSIRHRSGIATRVDNQSGLPH